MGVFSWFNCIFNGKKRGLIVTKKALSEKDVLAEAKKIENIKKNLKDKKIIKNIFVKNKTHFAEFSSEEIRVCNAITILITF